MRQIDLDNWPRRAHYEFFRGFDHPHFSMCANVDVTEFSTYVKSQAISFSVGFVYLMARAANAIPEFRHRLREDGVIEHDVVHPSYTLLVDQDLFSFCTVPYRAVFSEFAALAAERIASFKNNPTMENTGGDDQLYMTALPWVSFTSFNHPMHYHPADSVPRLAWGKFFSQGGRQLMPLDVLGHHALMDGLHVGRYYTKVQDYLDNIGGVLGKI